MSVTTASPTTGAASSSSSSSGKTALGSLTSNFNDFLNLLMTQLQNQDPTSPMDSTTFTSQLVQYASVEQQIDTNSNLTALIQATQSNTLLQSSSMVGKQVTVTSDHVPLQNGQASLGFNATSPGTVNIGVYTDSGVKLLQTTMSTTAGANSWTWDGRDSAGNKVADGSYKVAVVDPSGTALPTTVTGTVTGAERSNGTVNVVLGALKTDMSNVQSLANGS